MAAEGADESMDTEDAVLPSVVDDSGDGGSGGGDDCGGAGGNGGGGLGAPRTSCAQPNLLVACSQNVDGGGGAANGAQVAQPEHNAPAHDSASVHRFLHLE